MRQTVVDLPVFPRGDRIPSVIRQTFPRRDALPEEIEANIRHLRHLNPYHEYCFYDDSDVVAFIGDSYGEAVLQEFQRIGPEYGAARADLFRYLLMYKLGGIYLDIKSTAVIPFDRSLSATDQFLLSQWEATGEGEPFEGWGKNAECAHVPGGEFQQWHIIAAPGHPFLRAVIAQVLDNIQEYRPWVHGVGRLGTLRTTGPRVYTRTIFPLLPMYEHRLARSEEDLGLRYSIYGNQGGHRKLVQTYYRWNRTAVIQPSEGCRFAYSAYALLRGLVKGARRAMRTRLGLPRSAPTRETSRSSPTQA